MILKLLLISHHICFFLFLFKLYFCVSFFIISNLSSIREKSSRRTREVVSFFICRNCINSGLDPFSNSSTFPDSLTTRFICLERNRDYIGAGVTDCLHIYYWISAQIYIRGWLLGKILFLCILARDKGIFALIFWGLWLTYLLLFRLYFDEYIFWHWRLRSFFSLNMILIWLSIAVNCHSFIIICSRIAWNRDVFITVIVLFPPKLIWFLKYMTANDSLKLIARRYILIE